MERYVCVHGHFYQPPRENPWLEAIEVQDSAYPYHDWNERITAECYGPNATSRILDDPGFIVRIGNNYERISFNFGPTLLSWLRVKAPPVYQALLAADKASAERFGGHGSALAQAYNHLIMPLANRRDKVTQVRWGLRDFEHRFGRPAEGMWLPECAVDTESLEVLAEHGVRFTILAPGQAKATRPRGAAEWTDVQGGSVDPTVPYLVALPSGRSIAVFFYDGPISQDVAFAGLLQNGVRFASRLLQGYPDPPAEGPRLAHIATDGETYGHHHRHGDMALAFALQHIEEQGLARLTNYGAYLEAHPPAHEAQVLDNTSWSCAHGVERWRSDCSCSTGAHGDWNQAWRGPLRQALDGLRDRVAPAFEQAAGELFHDPWAARDADLAVVLDRCRGNVDAFLASHGRRALSAEEQVRALKLLELQRHAMLMYTSCGWFFDELTGIETVQVLQYAGRVIQLAGEAFGEDFEGPFLQQLEQARSNLPAHGTGREAYAKFVKPAMVDLTWVASHHALSSLFQPTEDEAKVYCYAVQREEARVLEAGPARLGVGRLRVTSGITRESVQVSYAVLHLGGHSVFGGARRFQGQEAFEALRQEVTGAFERGDLPETMRAVDRNFGGGTYSLQHLFRDEQRRIADALVDAGVSEVEEGLRGLHERHGPLMRFLADLGVPLPRAFKATAEVAVNAHLRRVLAAEPLDLARARDLLEEARREGLELDAPGLAYAVEGSLDRLSAAMQAEPAASRLRALDDLAALAASLPFPVELWAAQNRFYALLQEAFPERRREAAQGKAEAQAWVEEFRTLGDRLRVRVPP